MDRMLDSITLENRSAAAAFASPQKRMILQSLIGAELTLGDLRRPTGMSLSLLHYHVGGLAALGLVAVVREEPRAGRPVRHFRATARSFFVPAEHLVKAPGTGLTWLLRDRLDQCLARSLQGISFTHDGLNHRAHLHTDPDHPSTALELWIDAGLDAADASNLAADLQAIVDRYRARAKPGQPRHLVHVAAVRV